MNEMNYIVVAVLTLGGVALLAAVVLYIVSRRFAVKEDPRVKNVQECLPGANCGGCGFAGCAALAEALVKGADKGSLDGLRCPVGGDEAMGKIADVLGMAAQAAEPMVAVVRCNGSCDKRGKVAVYEGLHTCAAVNAAGAGESGCGYGCLGCGDCEAACAFGGIKVNKETGVPQIDTTLCTACGSCVKACPRHIIELRPRGVKNRRVYVACRNQDRGPAAMKVCNTACIGCGKCAKECPFGAIVIENNVAYIDYTKCRLCRKCVNVCPRKAITAVGFPPTKTQTSATMA